MGHRSGADLRLLSPQPVTSLLCETTWCICLLPAFAGSYCTYLFYPRKDDQAEFIWMAADGYPSQSTNQADVEQLCLLFIETNALSLSQTITNVGIEWNRVKQHWRNQSTVLDSWTGHLSADCIKYVCYLVVAMSNSAVL